MLQLESVRTAVKTVALCTAVLAATYSLHAITPYRHSQSAMQFMTHSSAVCCSCVALLTMQRVNYTLLYTANQHCTCTHRGRLRRWHLSGHSRAASSQHALQSVSWYTNLCSNFSIRWDAAHLASQHFTCPSDVVQQVVHVHWQPDRSAVVRYRLFRACSSRELRRLSLCQSML